MEFYFLLSKSFLVDVVFIFQVAYIKLFIIIKLINKCFISYTNIFLLVNDSNNIVEICLKTVVTKLITQKKKKKKDGEIAYVLSH